MKTKTLVLYCTLASSLAVNVVMVFELRNSWTAYREQAFDLLTSQSALNMAHIKLESLSTELDGRKPQQKKTN
jgi:hypothetical protein